MEREKCEKLKKLTWEVKVPKKAKRALGTKRRKCARQVGRGARRPWRIGRKVRLGREHERRRENQWEESGRLRDVARGSARGRSGAVMRKRVIAGRGPKARSRALRQDRRACTSSEQPKEKLRKQVKKSSRMLNQGEENRLN